MTLVYQQYENLLINNDNKYHYMKGRLGQRVRRAGSGKPVDCGPSAHAKLARALRRHAAQRDDGDGAARREIVKQRGTQRSAVGMRPCGKDRGEEQRIGPVAVREIDFARIMRGGEPQQPDSLVELSGRSVNTVGPPFDARVGIAREDNEVIFAAHNAAQHFPSLSTLRRLQMIMPEDEARAFGQRGERFLQRCVVAGIGEQPQVGKGMDRHRPVAIAARDG